MRLTLWNPWWKKQTYFFIHIWWSNNYLKWRGAATWWTEINCHQTWVGSKWTPGDRLRVKEIRLKNLTFVSRLSRSLRVIRTDTYRSAIYDFLLTFHSNHVPISHRFRDKRRFQSKIATTKIPRRHWRAAWNFEEFHDWLIDWRIDTLGIGYRRLGSKTRMMGLRGRERSLTIF